LQLELKDFFITEQPDRELAKLTEGMADTKYVELLRQSMGMNCDPIFWDEQPKKV
jgi:hypothetical protein